MDSGNGESCGGSEVMRSAAETLMPPKLKDANTSPPINQAATAGAPPPSSARDTADAGRRGSCHNRSNAGTTTCNTRNAIKTMRNIPAPFGQRSAAQARAVQPRIRQSGLNIPFAPVQPYIQMARASRAGQAFEIKSGAKAFSERLATSM